MKIFFGWVSVACLMGIQTVCFAAHTLGDPVDLAPGVGFSTATQQVTPNACYAIKGKKYSTSGSLVFSKEMSFTQLEDAVHMNVSAKVGFGPFSGQAVFSYMNSIKGTLLSTSLNYAQTIQQNVGYQILGLNAYGRQIYQADLLHKPGALNFDLICGNDFVKQYSRGAMLIASLKIVFASLQDKERFESATKAGLGNLFSASEQVSNIASEYHLAGTVQVLAYQMGGDPGRLSKILSNGKSITSCSLKDMKACQQVAQNIVDYAAQDFSTQVQPQSNGQITGAYSPLPLNVATDVASISRFSKKPLATVITPTIVIDRALLMYQLLKNEYYKSKLDYLLNDYPIAWNKSSATYRGIAQMDAQAANNVSVILRDPYNLVDSAAQCYNSPQQCVSVTRFIESHLQPITAQQLQVLNNIKYYINYLDWFYNGADWVPSKTSGSYPYVVGPRYYDMQNLTSGKINFYAKVQTSPDSGSVTVLHFEGTSTNGGEKYYGEAWTSSWRNNNDALDRWISPYYFTAYPGS